MSRSINIVQFHRKMKENINFSLTLLGNTAKPTVCPFW